MPLATNRSSLITMLSVALIALLGVSCHTNKETTATTKEQYRVEMAGSSHTATTSRLRWLSRLSLDMDSFEIVMPLDHFAEIGKMMGDTAMALPEQFDMGAGQPHQGSVVLRGKHASIGKTDIVQRNASRFAEQVDTLSAHRSIDKADHSARDTTGIMQPPDVTWWPWLLMSGALIACMIFWHKSHNQ